ncbi:MAG: hypothetical protein L0Z55_12760 [Planctomycetes bacterium]|nr:hypothetical protein [Planctomycetota bacterium]
MKPSSACLRVSCFRCRSTSRLVLAAAVLYGLVAGNGAITRAEGGAPRRESLFQAPDEKPSSRPKAPPAPEGEAPGKPARKENGEQAADGTGTKKESSKPDLEAEWPYPEETWIVYRWVKDGTSVGSTRFRITRGTDRAALFRVEAQFEFNEPGRSLRFDGLSVYDAKRQPVTYDSTRRLVANGLVGLTTVAAKFEAITITVSFDEQGSPVPKNRTVEMPRPAAGVLSEDHAFEHFALLAPILALNGSGEYNLVRPSNLLTFEKTRFTQVREEETSRGKAQRWTMEHPRMSADLWIAADGSLVRYRQDKLEITRDADEPSAADPKPGTPK